MRLICPECAAQYEVDVSVIPEAGRDVQCSSCGHTWWQTREENIEPAAQAEPAATDNAQDTPENASTPSPTPAEAPPASAQETAEDLEANVAATLSAAGGAAATAAVPNKSLDDAVLDVLREEAHRETTARKAEEPSKKTDTPAEEATKPAEEEPQGKVMFTNDGVPIAPRPRNSQLLPDIDEINSTLDGQEQADETEEVVSKTPAERPQKRGFRTGFLLMFTIALALVATYIYADLIAEKVPSLKPTLDVFIQKVDAARIWLDQAAVRATEAIKGLTSD